MDLALFTMYLAMDAGLKGSDNDVQVLLVYDKQSGKLEHCLPSDLKNELDGVAFKASLGEFSFMAVPSEGFVSRGDLYLDLLQIVLNTAEVKKLIVVPFNINVWWLTDLSGVVKPLVSNLFSFYRPKIRKQSQWQSQLQ